MSHDEMIPPTVAGEDAELLRRAYGLTSHEDSEHLYNEWATTYDRTMIDGLGYISPHRLAALVAEHVAWRDLPVLDIGCGTGLVGARLAENGFGVIDGIDLSLAMMATAGERGIYRDFIAADLNLPLPIDSGTYGAAVCTGTFTSGHVDAGCLDELVRVLRIDGYLACTVHHVVWESNGFAAAFTRLVDAGTIRPVDVFEGTFYELSPAPDGWFCLYQRAH